MSDVWNLPPVDTIQNVGKEWLFQVLQPLHELERSMLLMTLWRCWFIRNEIVHNKIPPPLEVSRRFLVSYLESLIAIKMNTHMDPAKGKSVISYDRLLLKDDTLPPPPVPKWAAPPEGWVNLNTDGSFDAGRAGAGMVLRAPLGGVIFSACRTLYSCREALEAELCACMEGLSLAIQRSDRPVAIELDSLVAIKLIQGQETDRSIYASLVKEIRYLSSLREVCITHVSRLQNNVSDSLANFARSEGRTMTWLGSGPSFAVELALADCNFDG